MAPINALFDRLENGARPVVAALFGTVLGGGSRGLGVASKRGDEHHARSRLVGSAAGDDELQVRAGFGQPHRH